MGIKIPYNMFLVFICLDKCLTLKKETKEGEKSLESTNMNRMN